MNVGGLHSDSRSGTLHLYIDCCRVDIDKATNTFINATLELESAIQQYQRAEAKLGSAVTNISKKVDTINQHIDKVLENAPTKLYVSVNVNDADWQKIQELFGKERQWMTAQMQMHIREVNSMFADERKKVCERYKEYDGCYLGHYAQGAFGPSSRLVSLWLQEA